MEAYPAPQHRDDFLWRQAKKRVGFKLHLRSYLLVNAGLWLIYVISTGLWQGHLHATTTPWPLFVMLSWGIGLASHYFAVHGAMDEKSMVEREYERLKNKP